MRAESAAHLRPSPPHGAITSAARRLGIARKRLSAFVNGHREPKSGEVVRFMRDPDLGPGSTFEQWTGTRIPAGLPLGGGLFALPGRVGPNGVIIPVPEPIDPRQTDIDDVITPEVDR